MSILLAQNEASLSVECQLPALYESVVIQEPAFPMIQSKDIEKGYIDAIKPLIVQISSNVDWQMIGVTSQENLYSTPGQFKSIQKMQWKTASTQFKSFHQANPSMMLKGNAGINKHDFKIQYRLLLDWKDASPGQWQFSPIFTIQPL